MTAQHPLRRLLSRAAVASLGLIASIVPAGTQPGRTMAIDDQPGHRAEPERRATASGLPAAGGVLPDQRAGRHDHRRYRRPLSLPGAGQQPRDPLRDRRRPRGIPVAGIAQDQPQGGVAGLDAAAGDDQATALPAPVHGRRSRQSHGRARALSRRDRVPDPRHQSAANDRQRRLVGMFPARERRRRPIFTSGCRSAPRSSSGSDRHCKLRQMPHLSSKRDPRHDLSSILPARIAASWPWRCSLPWPAAPPPPRRSSRVKQRGAVACGINPSLPASPPGRQRSLGGFRRRSVPCARCGDLRRSRQGAIHATADGGAVPALQAGKIDVLSRNTTWTFSREAPLKLNFAAVTYYDGQGFLVRRGMNATSSLELDGASVCVQKDTTSAAQSRRPLPRQQHEIHQSSRSRPRTRRARPTTAKQCTTLTSDTSQLFAERLQLGAPDDHVILPDIISKEPLGPVVRFGDDQWLNIVKWTHFAMLNAEELGVSSRDDR